MKNGYLEPTDPDAFADFLGKMPPMPDHRYTKPCPVCQQYGGWNLLLNSYPLRDKPNTPENRHRFAHFRASCSHCSGWGWVEETENCPGHQWEQTRNVGNCLNEYQCSVCQKKQVVDSSD